MKRLIFEEFFLQTILIRDRKSLIEMNGMSIFLTIDLNREGVRIINNACSKVRVIWTRCHSNMSLIVTIMGSGGDYSAIPAIPRAKHLRSIQPVAISRDSSVRL